MLKWTNSAQKPSTLHFENSLVERNQTPHIKKRLRRRTTICQMNKENLPLTTSTPLVTRIQNLRNVSSNKTPSPTLKSKNISGPLQAAQYSKYASTLPRFEEEYSPSTFLPSGQDLALRGILPDVFVGNKRYFSSPLVERQHVESSNITSSLTRRSLALELEDSTLHKCINTNGPASKSSTKMSDNSLDKLIDAILESACKSQKKKKRRKSLNLRRRTLLKTQEENTRELSLSPSYAAGYDPASDLSFLLVEPITTTSKNVRPTPTYLPPTPLPHTPATDAPISRELLAQMPTPAVQTSFQSPGCNSNVSTTTFNLETPIRPVRKRRMRMATADKPQKCDTHIPKKFRGNNCNYLEVGLALPSIYV